MAVEVALNLLHLFLDGLLGILLHLQVDGGINLQTRTIQVIAILLQPRVEIFGDGLTEIQCLATIVFLHMKFSTKLAFGVALVVRLRHVAMRHHIVEHGIATRHGVFGVRDRIIGSRGLEHSHEGGTLVGRQLTGFAVVIGLGRRHDTKGVVAEIYRVGIHRKNLLLGIDKLQLGGDNPLLALHDEHAHTRHLSQESCRTLGSGTEHILCQLLRNGGGTTGSAMKQSVLQGTTQSQEIDAMMAIETLVLGIDQSLPEYWIDLLILYRGAVLLEILTDKFAVRAVDFGRGKGGRFLYLHETGTLAKEPKEIDIDHAEIEEEGNDSRYDAYRRLGVPWTALIKVCIPREEALDGSPSVS